MSSRKQEHEQVDVREETTVAEMVTNDGPKTAHGRDNKRVNGDYEDGETERTDNEKQISRGKEASFGNYNAEYSKFLVLYELWWGYRY